MITTEPKNILVAGDGLFLRAKLSDILLESGHKVRFLNEPGEIIGEIKTNARYIDLVIIDLQEPGLDGFGILKWICENGFKSKFPIFAVTRVHESSETIEGLRKSGATGFISKDFAPEQILFRINKILFPEKASSGALRRRIPVCIPVDFTSGGVTRSGFLLNLSEGGAFLNTKAELQGGSAVGLEFSLPSAGEALKITGVIKWFTYEIAVKTLFVGYGVKFSPMPDEKQGILKRFIATESKRAGVEN